MITTSKRHFPPEPGLTGSQFATIAVAAVLFYVFFGLIAVFAS